MLSLFPEILFLAPFSALLIRAALALLLARSAWREAGNISLSARVLAVLDGALALLLLAGAWTQLVALVAAARLMYGLYDPRARITSVEAALLALVMCASLLVTGAGAFAFDLPL